MKDSVHSVVEVLLGLLSTKITEFPCRHCLLFAMEKFRSSADPSTGIHPFLPPKSKITVSNLLGIPLILLRLPVLLSAFCVYASLSFIPLALSSIPALYYRARRIIDVICLTPVLFALSVWQPGFPQLELPRVRTPAVNRTAAPGRGDLIFVNHASPLDVIYLARAFSPVFVTAPVMTATVSDAVVPLSFLAALRRVSCAPDHVPGVPDAPDASIDSLAGVCAWRAGPIVVLAEGCASNAAGVLHFVVNLHHASLNTERASAPFRVFALGLAYSADRREARPVGTLLRNALHLLTLPSATIRARIAAVAFDADLQRSVASLAGVPALSVGRETGAKFFDHWRATHS